MSSRVNGKFAEQMTPEDGCLSVIDSFDDNVEATTAFTRCGLDCLDELVNRRRSDLMKQS